MNEIYPIWVEAHGIMIVTPVNWYQVSSPLKLMMDRLVCADGGNPDPRQGPEARQGDRARRLGLSPPPRRPPVLGHRSRRRRGCGERPLQHRGPAALHSSRPGRTARRARPLDRRLAALRHEPRRVSTATRRSRTRSATPPGRCSKPSRPPAPDARSARAIRSRSHVRSDRVRGAIAHRSHVDVRRRRRSSTPGPAPTSST
jgi:hypothetical protein